MLKKIRVVLAAVFLVGITLLFIGIGHNCWGWSKAGGWNGTFDIKGNVLTITNANYNGDIAIGATVVTGCNLGIFTEIQQKQRLYHVPVSLLPCQSRPVTA